MIRYAFVLVFCACHGSSSTPPSRSGSSAPRVRLDHAGETCGSNQSCPDGLSCLHYYPGEVHREPGVYTCELPCTADAKCPTGTTCSPRREASPSVCH